MNYVVTRWIARSLLALAALGSAHLGADEADFKLEEGYTSLFNGKDLTGWQFVTRRGKVGLDAKTESPNKRFQVVDGIIVANVGRGIEDLYTTQQFNSAFHLKLEFRAAPRADSGVYIRGTQLQVRDYPAIGPYNNLKHFKNGDWNLLDITVKGREALCKCNDEVVEKAFRIPARGGIGLQAESGKFEFRHIRIKILR